MDVKLFAARYCVQIFTNTETYTHTSTHTNRYTDTLSHTQFESLFVYHNKASSPFICFVASSPWDIRGHGLSDFFVHINELSWMRQLTTLWWSSSSQNKSFLMLDNFSRLPPEFSPAEWTLLVEKMNDIEERFFVEAFRSRTVRQQSVRPLEIIGLFFKPRLALLRGGRTLPGSLVDAFSIERKMLEFFPLFILKIEWRVCGGGSSSSSNGYGGSGNGSGSGTDACWLFFSNIADTYLDPTSFISLFSDF